MDAVTSSDGSGAVVGDDGSGGSVLQRFTQWLRVHFPPLVKHDESLVMLLVLGGVYFLVFLMSLTQLLRTHYRLNKSITKAKLFFIFTAFCALVRGIFPCVHACALWQISARVTHLPRAHSDTRHHRLQTTTTDVNDPEQIRTVFFVSLAFLPVPLFLTYSLDATIAEIVLSNLPGYLFFSTYCLLIVYWAEIVDRVRNPTYTLNALLRPTFVACNSAIYVVETVIWVLWGVWSSRGETHHIKTVRSNRHHSKHHSGCQRRCAHHHTRTVIVPCVSNDAMSPPPHRRFEGRPRRCDNLVSAERC